MNTLLHKIDQEIKLIRAGKLTAAQAKVILHIRSEQLDRLEEFIRRVKRHGDN